MPPATPATAALGGPATTSAIAPTMAVKINATPSTLNVGMRNNRPKARSGRRPRSAPTPATARTIPSPGVRQCRRIWRSVRRQHISSTRDQVAYGRSSDLAEPPPPRPRRQRTRSRRRARDQAPRIRQRDGIHPHEDDPADSTNERTKSPIHTSMKPPVQEDQNKVVMSAKSVQRAPRRGVELGDRRVGPCRDPGLRHPLRCQLPTQRGRDPVRRTVVSRCVVRRRQWDAIRSLE